MQFSHGARAVLAIGLLSGAAQAALVDRGNGMVYDTDRNITWLANGSLFKTQFDADPGVVADVIAHVPTVSNGRTTHALISDDFRSNGLLTWWGAMAWAENLQYGGFSDWRLPTSMQPDAGCTGQNRNANLSYGYGCTGSELGHLFYDELGGIAGNDLQVQHNASFNLFTQVKTDYWTATPLIFPGAGDGAFLLDMHSGEQQIGQPAFTSYAWAVRDGDIAAAVPLPTGGALAVAALVALAAVRRQHRPA